MERRLVSLTYQLVRDAWRGKGFGMIPALDLVTLAMAGLGRGDFREMRQGREAASALRARLAQPA